MRKFAGSLVVAVLFFSLLAPTVLADSASGGIAVLVDGQSVTGDGPAYLDPSYSRVFAPVRAVAEALGATVLWDGEHRAVLINTPAFPAGAAAGKGITVLVAGKPLAGDAAPVLENGHVFAPVRPLAEALQAAVTWDGDARRVLITRGAEAQIQAGLQQLQAVVADLQAALQKDDATAAARAGEALEESWAGFEDQVRAKDRSFYAQVEDLLDPIVAGSSVSPLDVKTLSDLAQKLDTLVAGWATRASTAPAPDTAALAAEFSRETPLVQDALNGVGLTPHIAPDGSKEFTLTAAPATWQPVQGAAVPVWAYNGQVPGPVIRITEGDHVRITLVNTLPEPTTIHWHGLHLPNAMDGVPGVTQAPVQPGQSFVYEFTASHPGTFIYHSHFDDLKQVAKGLSGTFIIDPKNPSAEVRYDHDYTMLLSSLHLGDDVDEEPDYFTINGRSFPDTPPITVKKGETVRLRLIDIDPIEFHTMHLHGMDFTVIAKDGHPAPGNQKMNTLTIGPGETYDIAFTADAVGTWIFHCHILDHVMNAGDQAKMGGLITLVKVEP